MRQTLRAIIEGFSAALLLPVSDNKGPGYRRTVVGVMVAFWLGIILLAISLSA
jgi:hypothetical protein